MSVDLDDFREEHDAALKQASEFARRAEKGLPSDRYGSAKELWLTAKGIRAMQRIIDMQTDALEDMWAAQIAASASAMTVYDRAGRETS